MKRFTKAVLALCGIAVLAAALLACGGSSDTGSDEAGSKPKFRIMWSIYAGWMPWPYAYEQGIVKKWADKYGIEVEFVQADYIPSVEVYVAGQADGVVMTNMEALNMAAAAGVDTTAVVVGDYSNGNDAVITRKNIGLCDLRGRNVYLVELSVSQYLLSRGLDTRCQGQTSERDLKLVNSSDSDIGPVFISDSSQEVVVTWNPIVLEVMSQARGATTVFDSSKIPHEILDILFVKTETLQKHPELGKALAGAWYETLGIMSGRGAAAEQAIEAMAERSGATSASYKKQLTTTYMYWDPAEAATFTRSDKLIQVMDLVRTFSFDHGLWQDAKSVNTVGIEFPGGRVLGDSNNVKLRFSDVYMREAAEGQ